MDLNAILASAIGSGPVAGVLVYWVVSERKERRDLQAKLIQMLETYAGTGEATLGELRSIRGAIRKIAGLGEE